METQIYLVRHGKTAANLENRFAGRTAESLHSQGIAQIVGLAAKLAPLGITDIVAGPLARTVQSGEILGQTLAAPVRSDDGLTDILIPHWDGCTKDEIRERFGPEYPTWLETPDRFALPGCETLHEVQKRAVASVERLFAGHPGGRLLVVSHLVVIRCLLLHYYERPMAEYRDIKVDNGAICRLSRNDAGETLVSRQNGAD